MLFHNLSIFVDGGGNNGKALKKYLSDFPPFHRVYAFEPNPAFFGTYNGLNITLLKKAIWTHNGKLPFYLCKQENQVGSSIFANKLTNIGHGPLIPFLKKIPIEVECVDFSQWIKDNTNYYDNLILKLDIEGAEYEVLWKMINDGTIKHVKKLFVEFHWRKIQMKEESHLKLIKALKACGLSFYFW